MSSPPAHGLPPRIYLPILALIAVVFIAIMVYLLRVGFGVTGSAFGVDVNKPQPTQGPRSTK